MERDSTLPDRVAQVIKDITDLKSTQPMSSDSWIVYRYSGSFLADPSNSYQIDFVPDSPGPFTAQIWRKDNGQLGPFFPDPSINGRAYFTQQLVIPVNVEYMIYSTKKGNVNITSTPNT